MTMQFTLKTLSADKIRSQCIILPVQAGQLTATGEAIDARLGQLLTAALKTGDLGRKPGATLLVPGHNGLSRVLLVSMGEEATLPAGKFAEAVRAAIKAVSATQAASATCCLHEALVEARELPWKVGQIVLLAREVAYRFVEYKSKPEPAASLKELVLPVAKEDGKPLARVVEQMSAVADGIDTSRSLGNQPGNVCHPTYLAEQAKKLGRKLKFKVEVLDQKQMGALKMGALLAVAQGSAQPPKLIVMHYKGAGARQAPIVLVGKGITFDTGGISIKPAADMDEMKYDMSGASSVFGVMQAVAQMKLKINLTVIIAAAENMPSGTASRPGDIVTTMSGQTVEILNTDAEGRLVLCDALTYAERFKPAAVIDVATLTGACVIALGHQHAGLFSNDEALSAQLAAAGKASGDTCWPMPLDEAYQESLRSPFADMANVGGRAGGAITAACYLSRFAKAYPWAHLDIAGVAWRSGASKGATGRPVALLTRFLMDRAG
ncbi:MAG: leucyl aminopeptidase [Lautropia sp.]|nr:leucyl aminopeptidase [Lautropia sp.]